MGWTKIGNLKGPKGDPGEPESVTMTNITGTVPQPAGGGIKIGGMVLAQCVIGMSETVTIGAKGVSVAKVPLPANAFHTVAVALTAEGGAPIAFLDASVSQTDGVVKLSRLAGQDDLTLPKGAVVYIQLVYPSKA